MVGKVVLKKNAKDQLRGKWGLAISAFVIVGIISSIISIIGSLAESDTIYIIGTIVAVIISGPLNYGLCTFILNIVRGNDATISDVVSGFNGKVFIKSFIIAIVTGIAISIGTLILIVPGIILSIMFSQSMFILVDNNDLSGIDCIKLSCEMMKGNKKYFFVLILSFIGWFIIGEIPCGIGLLWVIPYYNITIGNFYNQFKNNISEVI